DESGALVELRASFHAAAAGDAARERIGTLLLFRRKTWAWAEVVGAVHRYPCLHPLQVLEEHAAIDSEVANDRKLGERFKADRLVKVIDQRGACHARPAVDEHGAGSANFLEAIGI